MYDLCALWCCWVFWCSGLEPKTSFSCGTTMYTSPYLTLPHITLWTVATITHYCASFYINDFKIMRSELCFFFLFFFQREIYHKGASITLMHFVTKKKNPLLLVFLCCGMASLMLTSTSELDLYEGIKQHNIAQCNVHGNTVICREEKNMKGN